jgi:hypothetical protein
VPPDRVQRGPSRLAGGVQPNDGKPSLAFGAEQSMPPDAVQVSRGRGVA